MTESIGTARLDIVVDTSKFDAGISSAKRSTADMAKAAKQASDSMSGGTKKQVAALERQIATLGKSRAEVIRWRIEQQTSGKTAADLAAKLDAQARAMNNANKAAHGFGRGLGSAVRSLAAFLGVSVSLKAAFDSIKGAIDRADQLRDFSIRLGIGTEALSVYGYAARQTGTDLEVLNKGLLRLSRNATEALNPKSKQAGLFGALGVGKDSLTDLTRLLPQVADAFAGMQDGATKAAIAQQLFGKSGAELIEFLNQGSTGLKQMGDRARELGIIIDQDTANAADQFNDKLSDLKAAAGGLAQQVASGLLPSLTELVEWATDFVKDGDNARAITDDLASSFRDLAQIIGTISQIGDVFGSIRTGMADMERAARESSFSVANLIRLAKGLPSLKTERLEQGRAPATTGFGMQFPIPGVNDRFFAGSVVPFANPAGGDSALEKRLGAFLAGGGAKKSGAKKAKSGKSDEQRAAEQLEEAYKRTVAQLKEQIAFTGDLSEVEKTRYQLANGELAKLSEGKKTEILSLTAQLEAAKKQQEVVEEGKRLTESLLTPTEELNKLRAKADKLLAAGAISQDTHTRALKAYQGPLKDLLDDMQFELDMIGKTNAERAMANALREEGISLASQEAQAAMATARAFEAEAKARQTQIDLMDDFRQGASNALADFVTGTKSAKDALKDFFDDMARRITQAIAERWIEQLFGAQGGTGGGTKGGGWLAQIFGAIFGGKNANGNAFSNGSVTAFATGGVVSRPTMFGMSSGRLGLMGEAGPEAILPLHRGPDGKLGVKAANDDVPRGRGDFHQTVNQVYHGPLTKRTAEQSARASGREARRSMARTG